MGRPVTLFTGQWADLPLEDLAKKAAGFGDSSVGPSPTTWWDKLCATALMNATSPFCPPLSGVMENLRVFEHELRPK